MTTLATAEYKDRVGYYPYGDAEEKKECRKFKLECVKPYIPNVKSVLTLAADTLSFEKMLAETFNTISVIDSYEIRRDVYKQGLPKYKQLKKEHSAIRYKNADIFDAKFSQYDVIDLDLCGTFTNQTMIEMISAFQQFKQGFVFITMTKNVRNSKFVRNIEHFGYKTLSEFRDKGFAKYMKTFCNLDEYCKPYEYANKSVNKHATEMIMYVFTKNVVWAGSRAGDKELKVKKNLQVK